MKLSEALIILEQFNKWRRDNSIPLPNKYEMPDPKQIGLAIDVILECHKKKENSNQQNNPPLRDTNTYFEKGKRM